LTSPARFRIEQHAEGRKRARPIESAARRARPVGSVFFNKLIINHFAGTAALGSG